MGRAAAGWEAGHLGVDLKGGGKPLYRVQAVEGGDFAVERSCGKDWREGQKRQGAGWGLQEKDDGS